MNESRKPSPAILVAVLALVAALAGTAIASPVANKALTTKKVKKIANKQIKKKAPGLTVGNAENLGGLDPNEYKTASNYTQDSTDNPITSEETIGSPIQITTQSTRRVIATSAVHAVNGVGGTGVYLVCRITIDGTSGVEDTDYASPAGGFSVVDASVSPLASAVVGAGTHTVTLLCRAVGGASPSATVADDALAAWAVSG